MAKHEEQLAGISPWFINAENPGKEADTWQIGSLPMEDKLEPAARLVDFLLGCTSDFRAKDVFPNTKYEGAFTPAD